MLQILRKSISSWVGILILVLALGALVFTLFQPTGPGGSAQSGGVLATVGDTAIHEATYQAAVERAVARERERQPTITNPDFLQAGGGEMVLQQLVAGLAMQDFATKHGLTVSRRMVDGEIASIPAFQVNGKFDDATFRRLLADQRITEAELRESIHTDLLRRQLLQPLLSGATVPASMAKPYAELMLEARSGTILPVPSAAMAQPAKPTEAQLQEFHTKNKAAYTLPERRAFRFAEIDMSALAAKAKPTAEEVRKYYDENPGEFGGLEQRDIVQIVLPDEAAAKAFAAKVEAGTSFADAAKAEGFAEGDIAIGTLTKDGLTTQLGADVANAAFATAQGQVSAPIKGKFGWHVLQVRSIAAANAQNFATVAPVIEQKLAAEKAADLAANTVADAEDRLAEGESLADVAKSVGAALQTSPALTVDGRLFDENYASTTVNQPLLPKVFEAVSGDGPQVVEVAEGRFALLEVTDIIAPTPVPLDKIKADVEQAWIIKARSDAAKAEAERIATALNNGETLPAATAGKKLPPVQKLTVRRLELTQMLSQGQQVPPPVMLLLNTPKGKARTIPAPGGQGWFVVLVEDVKAGNLNEAPQLVDGVRQSLLRDSSNELAESFVRAIERDARVVQKPEALKAVNRRMSGVIEE